MAECRDPALNLRQSLRFFRICPSVAVRAGPLAQKLGLEEGFRRRQSGFKNASLFLLVDRDIHVGLNLRLLAAFRTIRVFQSGNENQLLHLGLRSCLLSLLSQIVAHFQLRFKVQAAILYLQQLLVFDCFHVAERSKLIDDVAGAGTQRCTLFLKMARMFGLLRDEVFLDLVGSLAVVQDVREGSIRRGCFFSE